MRLRDRFWLGLALVVGFLTLPSLALGQAWLKDRDAKEGTGIRLGDFELHPGIGVLGGYETNPFYRDEQDTGGQQNGVVPAASIRVSPHLDFSTLSRKRRQDSDQEVQLPVIDFRGGISGILNHYFADGQSPTLEGRIDLREEFLPERPFSLSMLQEASRSRIPIQGGNQFNDHVAAGITPQLATPGGLLKGRLGYKFSFDHFNEDLNDNLIHTFSEHLSWEFLPKTALFEEIELGLQMYPNDISSTTVAQGAASTDKNDITRVTGRAGLNGALTKELAMTLSGGITNAWVENASDGKAPILQAQLRWKPAPAYRMMVDGSMSNQNALQGNTVTRIAGGLRGELTVGGVAMFRLGGKVEALQYGDDTQQLSLRPDGGQPLTSNEVDRALAFSTDPRSDLKVTLEASGEYRFVSWLALTLELAYIVNSSDYYFLTPLSFDDDGNPATADVAGFNANSAAYENFRVYGGLRAFL